MDGKSAFGAAKAGGLVNLTPHFAGQGIVTLRGLLAAGSLATAREILSEAEPDVAFDGVTFLPVIPDPDKIICIGLNYRDHVAETGRQVTEKPALFARYAGSQVGHLQPMIKPRVSEEFDYEGELAVVIGTTGRHVSPALALQHVAGYACYNEGSVRDWQRHTGQFLAGKTFAGTGAFGPLARDHRRDPGSVRPQDRDPPERAGRASRSGTDMMINGVPRARRLLFPRSCRSCRAT